MASEDDDFPTGISSSMLPFGEDPILSLASEPFHPGWNRTLSLSTSTDPQEDPSTPRDSNTDASKPSDESTETSEMKIEFVDQTWDQRRHNWETKTIERSQAFSGISSKSSKPVLIIRRQFGVLETKDDHVSTFADIKAEGLRDALREILSDVKSVTLRGDKPTIRLDVLFAYLPELKAYFEAGSKTETASMKQLGQLLDFLDEWYSSARENLLPLLEHGEITYDLLWALFKPNSTVFTICQDSEQPKCLIYDYGGATTRKGQKYFEMCCRSLYFDGRFFGEVQTFLKIPEFRGARKITALEVFPLHYHTDASEIETELVSRGRKFMSLMGVIHCEFKGLAFYKNKGKPIKFNIKGRTIIDAASFKELNANYANLNLDPEDEDYFARRYEERRQLENGGTKVKKSLQASEISDDEALLCSPVVQGFSLSKRVWAEFTVSGIYDIAWNELPFDALVLPSEKKDLLQALVQQTTSESPEPKFEDVVEDKGQGLVVLLHGSPGVGKTLTAEAVSEYQKRPLYRVTAGDLDLDSRKLENKLSEILDLATRWKAIVLLDEADVFVESRTLHNLHHNTLVSVFLRQLEYFQGVMILTTNRVTVFDDAIKSRIHLGIKYDDLNKEARAKVWKTFIQRADLTGGGGENEKKNTVSAKQVGELAERKCNGRQIKNTVRIAHALAASKNVPLGYEHLISALDANEDFDNEHRGLGRPANESSYV